MPNLQRLIEILESLRRVNHDECEDGFYSCPAHPGYFGNDSSGECNCGLVKDNALVDEALQIVGGLTKDAPDFAEVCRQIGHWWVNGVCQQCGLKEPQSG